MPEDEIQSLASKVSRLGGEIANLRTSHGLSVSEVVSLEEEARGLIGQLQGDDAQSLSIAAVKMAQSRLVGILNKVERLAAWEVEQEAKLGELQRGLRATLKSASSAFPESFQQRPKSGQLAPFPRFFRESLSKLTGEVEDLLGAAQHRGGHGGGHGV